MTTWVVRRWARYGHERLYAETPGGTALGYLDLKTGRFHSDDLSNLPLLEKAIGDHLAAQEAVTPESEQVALGEPKVATDAAPTEFPTPLETATWVDISGARAGSAAREQAVAAREAQGKVSGFLARLLDVKTEERAWRIGADGEQAVAEQLAKLGPEWRVLPFDEAKAKNVPILLSVGYAACHWCQAAADLDVLKGLKRR